MWCRGCCSNDDMLAATTATVTGFEEEVLRNEDESSKMAVPPAVSRADGAENSGKLGDQAYRVKVTKVQGKLGVVIGYLDEEDAQARVTQILPGSAMEAWNVHNPDRPVLANFVVLEVNGSTSAAEICREIRESNTIDMLVQMSNSPPLEKV
mmetsp:Transcript_1076/g.3008  ORF Transcript_1076/g.3008 Transcript_1076/m.3008 type:complete len:152 (+) Transcript_1076:77-532(+)